MTILLVLLLLIFTLLILRLFIVKEGFQTTELDPNFLQNYGTFVSFYNQFQTNWQKAIISSIAADTDQTPVTSAKEINPNSQPAPPSQTQMNLYIANLSQQLGQPLPEVTDPLPLQVSAADLPQVMSSIPKDTQPYQNALNWMNQQLQKSQANLGTALQGQPIETFEDMCQDLSQCIANNPQIAQQIAQQQQQQQQQQQKNLTGQISTLINNFNMNNTLQDTLQTNNTLVQQSQDIQNKAQSGELFNQISTPTSQTTYTLPPNANALSSLQQNNPQQYNNLKQNYGKLFGLKQLYDQINSNL
jgi:hypothetical protein